MENKKLKCFMESFRSFLLEKVSPEVNGGISHHHGFKHSLLHLRTKQSDRSDLCSTGFYSFKSHGEKQTADFFKKTTRHCNTNEIQVQSHHHTAPYNVQSRR